VRFGKAGLGEARRGKGTNGASNTQEQITNHGRGWVWLGPAGRG